MFLIKHGQFLLTLCFVFCCFLPVHIILDIHSGSFEFQSEVARDNTKFLVIIFLLSIITGTIVGLIFWTMLNLFKLMFRLLLLTVFANVLLVIFSFIDTQSTFRFVILFMFYGLLIGAIQVTVTTFFGEQYSNDDPNYTLYHHYVWYVALHILANSIAHYIVSTNQHYGHIYTLEDYYIYEFLLMLILNLIALVLVIILSKNAPVYESEKLNIMQVQDIDVNQILLVSLVYYPLIFVQICVRMLDKQNSIYLDSMDNVFEISKTIICLTEIYAIKRIIAFLCILIVIYVIEFDKGDFYGIRFGCWLIILSTLLSGILQLNITDSFHQYRKPRGESGLIRFLFNGNDYSTKLSYSEAAAQQNDITFRHQFYFQNTLTLHSLDNFFVMQPTWDQYNTSNFSDTSLLRIVPLYMNDVIASLVPYVFRRGGETWNIYNSMCEYQIPMYTTYAFPKVYRRKSSMPIVYIIQNYNYSLKFISDKFNLTTGNYRFYEILDDAYTVHVDNIPTGLFKLKRGGMYIFMLYYPVLDACTKNYLKYQRPNNIASMLQVIKPYEFHIIWQLPQYFLLITGIIMLISSTLKLSFFLANPKVKCQVIFVFCFVYDIGYCLYYAVYDTLGVDKSNALIIVILVISVGIIHIFEYLFDYKLLSK